MSERGQQTSRMRDRSDAFRQAARHSKRVRYLRIAIVVGSAVVVGALIMRAFYDPFSSLPGGVTVGQTTLNGTRVTMEMPKLSGFRSDGRPYDVRARSGVQDIRTPSIIELNELDARFDARGGATLRIEAPRGIYDGSKDFIQLFDGVHITSESGYDIRMKDAEMDFKLGNISSPNPVTVVMTSGTINADSLEARDNGDRILFNGNVRTMFHNSSGGQPAEETAK